MSDSTLKQQIIRDRQIVDGISQKSQNAYQMELRSTLNQGAFYSFGSKQSIPKKA
ncbi:hypothetical protein [Sphingorhabdus wooponensis]|uniref:hypothetical protein n=1 Tax=Sphingorhabdus wooponensis TaxID=940136 RepID=UPI00163B0665|nr:hypothetical protein [Sphingorhabdus wooponensis]